MWIANCKQTAGYNVGNVSASLHTFEIERAREIRVFNHFSTAISCVAFEILFNFQPVERYRQSFQ